MDNRPVSQEGRAAYEERISEILAIMQATLKGKDNVNRAALGQGWMMALYGRLPIEWLYPTCESFVVNSDNPWFPSPGQFISAGKNLMEQAESREHLEATSARLRAEAEAESKRIRSELQSQGVNPDAIVSQEHIKALMDRMSAVPALPMRDPSRRRGFDLTRTYEPNAATEEE
jgi:hypothetical protein